MPTFRLDLISAHFPRGTLVAHRVVSSPPETESYPRDFDTNMKRILIISLMFEATAAPQRADEPTGVDVIQCCSSPNGVIDYRINIVGSFDIDSRVHRGNNRSNSIACRSRVTTLSTRTHSDVNIEVENAHCLTSKPRFGCERLCCVYTW